ncbi:PadR family transcriptional regulator [Phycicoccus jejuensis]|uniref:PadR family transcriptional regulator n=1 Tax=Phycicoccus jejuensis TaxID=367299 RepID=UPI0004C34D68|nr:PadR family transcriptional regulator [Phycicoccus jejuensis]
MSVRLGLMALLAEGDSYGARLRSDFEERTGGTWPLNVGQVYTTIERLVRDGLVEQAGEADAEGRISYRLTAAGRAELDAWWTTPVDRTSTPRDELTIKLALAVTAPGVDVAAVVQGQRTATLRHLRDLTRLKRDALDRAEGSGEGVRDGADGGGGEHGLAWLLVLEHLVFAAEAEVRWLDHVESALARHARRTPAGSRRAGHDSAGEVPAHREGTHA